MAAVGPSTGEGGVPPKRKRGRRRKEGTLTRTVRLRVSVYDRYILAALRAKPEPLDVGTVMRMVLEMHAPPDTL